MTFTINAVGNALTPFDSFLLLRGTKTLAIRMDRQQETAMLVAQMLQHLGFVTHYPGLPNHPGKEVHDRIADGLSLCLYLAVLSIFTLNWQVTVLFCLSKRGTRSLASASLVPLVYGASVSASEL
jgi:cystathionine beta-lyase/cystathionine gamma-synthase